MKDDPQLWSDPIKSLPLGIHVPLSITVFITSKHWKKWNKLGWKLRKR